MWREREKKREGKMKRKKTRDRKRERLIKEKWREATDIEMGMMIAAEVAQYHILAAGVVKAERRRRRGRGRRRKREN